MSPQPIRRQRPRILLPLTILAGAVALSSVFWLLREPPPPSQAAAPRVLPVDVLVVERQRVQIDIPANGEVTPVHETQLASGVSGQVVMLSPKFVAGGWFNKNEALARLDPRDYRNAVARAKAELATARRGLIEELGRADVARREWNRAGTSRRDGQAKHLALRQPQLREMRAKLSAAQANLSQAKDNLRRTVIRAPYVGIVRSREVDLGSYVGVGAVMGMVFSAASAQVRLPLPERVMSLVSVKPPGAGKNFPEPVVELFVTGVPEARWQGRLVRVEGTADPVSRVLYAVAQVDDPYGLKRRDDGYLPLRVGSFVNARVGGRELDGVVVLPREVLRAGDSVWTLDAENHLRLSEISYLSIGGTDRLYVTAGLADGDRVCLNPLGTVLPGTQAKVLSEISSREWGRRLGITASGAQR